VSAIQRLLKIVIKRHISLLINTFQYKFKTDSHLYFMNVRYINSTHPIIFFNTIITTKITPTDIPRYLSPSHTFETKNRKVGSVTRTIYH